MRDQIVTDHIRDESEKYKGLTIEEKATLVVKEMGETGQIMKVAWAMEIEKALNAQIKDCEKAVKNRLEELWKEGFGPHGSFSAVLLDIRALAGKKGDVKDNDR